MLVSRRPNKITSDNYCAIFIDRFSSKIKIWEDSWYFYNSLLCKPNFSLAAKNWLSSLNNQKKNYYSRSNCWEYIKSKISKTFHHAKEYQHLKVQNLMQILYWTFKAKKCFKTYFILLERQYVKSNNF